MEPKPISGRDRVLGVIKRLLPLVFGAATLVYLFTFKVTFEDVKREVSQIETGPLWMALGLGGVGFAASALRLQYLVGLLGYRVSFLRSLIYTLVGQLYNSAIPGGTIGGDAIKALYLASHTHHKAHAFAAVLIDRICGLFTLGTFALIMLIPEIGDPTMLSAAAVIVGFLGAGSVAVTLMLSRRVRKLFPQNAVARLPFQGTLKAFDDAVQIFRGRMEGIAVALLLSLLPQIGWIGMHFAIGEGLNIRGVSWMDYCVLIPVSGMVAALPISFGGWGVGEAATVYFFSLRGVAPESAFVLSALGRLIQLAWALLALPISFFLPRPAQVAAALAKETEAAPAEPQ